MVNISDFVANRRNWGYNINTYKKERKQMATNFYWWNSKWNSNNWILFLKYRLTNEKNGILWGGDNILVSSYSKLVFSDIK